jgi:enamine deaminase RidA (YjgF/YER057c/UK114 family)
MRINIPGTSPYEPIIGFSRAVRVGNVVHLSGTGPVGADNKDAAGQTRRIFEIAEEALTKAGATFDHVVRTRMYIAHVEDWEAVGRVHGEYFGSTRPAATMVVVAALLNPSWRIEMEFEALIPDAPAQARAVYRSLSIWERAGEGLYRYRVVENLLTGKFTAQMRDRFGTAPSIPKDWLQGLDKYFVELLVEESPENRGGAFSTIEEAIQAFDEYHDEPTQRKAPMSKPTSASSSA